MKYVLLILSMMILAACDRSGSSFSQLSTNPPAVQPPPTVTPAPPGTTWPLAGAVHTETLGSISCSSFALGMKCYDGTNIATFNAMNFVTVSDIKISADVICALVEPNGPTSDCADLNSCATPAHVNTAYCMNVSDLSLVNMIAQGDHIGFPSSTYQTGPKALSIVGGQMCIETTAYFTGAAFDSNTVSCGTSVNTAGHLE